MPGGYREGAVAGGILRKSLLAPLRLAQALAAVLAAMLAWRIPGGIEPALALLAILLTVELALLARRMRGR